MSLALLTDLYELTMMAGYFTAGFMPEATFELYVRELPPNRSYLIAAGLEQALEYLEHLRFTAADVEHLRTVPALRRVRSDFFDEYLPRFRLSDPFTSRRVTYTRGNGSWTVTLMCG